MVELTNETIRVDGRSFIRPVVNVTLDESEVNIRVHDLKYHDSWVSITLTREVLQEMLAELS